MRIVATLSLLLAAAPALHAFPHMLRDLGMNSIAEFEQMAKRGFNADKRAGPMPDLSELNKLNKRAPLSIPLPPLTVPGLPLPRSIDVPFIISVGTKIIPDAAHPFQNPPPGAQRGGCPGLNIMSNYGYMNRNGVVTAGELIYAMQEMLGYSLDLSLVLVALAIRSGAMDITTLKMSIGGTDSRTSGLLSAVLGPAPGLFDIQAHGRYEIDGSMAYDDSYFHRTQPNAGSFFNGTLFAEMQALADQTSGGLFDLKFHQEHRYARYLQCIANNPTCTWNPVGQLLFYGADTYTYLGMASTDPVTSQIGAPDALSVQTFFGAKKTGDTFTFTPEKLLPGPDGHWYRRSTPLTTAEIAGQIPLVYSAHIVPFGSNDGTNVNSFTPDATQPSAEDAMCFILTQITENDGAIGQRFGIAASAVLKIIQSLVTPANQALSCPPLQPTA